MKLDTTQLLNLKVAIESYVEALNFAVNKNGDQMLKFKIDNYLVLLYKINTEINNKTKEFTIK